ncbi:MAG: three-Cys-motif partner protein TcmP [Candidatus Neomarinimicrobiota bacterium]
MIHDDIGIWSEIKLEILHEYASTYSRILANQRDPSFKHIYIDAFAGSGLHTSRSSGNLVHGSPLNALDITPSFREYYFIDIDDEKVDSLRSLIGQREDVFLLGGDCNNILLSDVFPNLKYEDYRRGLCFLDPYKINLDWQVVVEASRMGSMELFINFSTHYINRTILRKKRPDEIDQNKIILMNKFWGDETWQSIAYRQQETLFGAEEQKITNNELAKAYAKRLKDVAGFAYVPEPMPMKNSRGSTIYYLFFASHKPVAKDIVDGIFRKYRGKGF